MVSEKTGYITNQTAVESVRPSAGNQPSQNLILSPNITSDQVRFVLSWGETPHDLDLHLRGPGENGDDYGHVYWWNSKYEDDA